jgi:hypothetical protein
MVDAGVLPAASAAFGEAGAPVVLLQQRVKRLSCKNFDVQFIKKFHFPFII